MPRPVPARPRAGMTHAATHSRAHWQGCRTTRMHTHAFLRGSSSPAPHKLSLRHTIPISPPVQSLTLAVANISACDGAVTGRTEEWWCEIFHAPSTCGAEGVSAQRQGARANTPAQSQNQGAEQRGLDMYKYICKYACICTHMNTDTTTRRTNMHACMHANVITFLARGFRRRPCATRRRSAPPPACARPRHRARTCTSPSAGRRRCRTPRCCRR